MSKRPFFNSIAAIACNIYALLKYNETQLNYNWTGNDNTYLRPINWYLISNINYPVLKYIVLDNSCSHIVIAMRWFNLYSVLSFFSFHNISQYNMSFVLQSWSTFIITFVQLYGRKTNIHFLEP